MTKLLTVAEVAERLNVSESTIYDLVATRKLSCHRIGGRGRGTIRFTPEQVEAFLASTLQEAGPTPAEAPPPPSSAAPFSELDPRRLARAWKKD